MTHVIFGDLFLQDIREYRETKLRPIGVAPVFPLWDLPTDALAKNMISGCVEAYIATVDLKKLPAAFAGRRFDHQLLANLPDGVDPRGENGEFHTFVAAGPMMKGRIAVTVGETVERDGFAYADLIPA